MAYTTIDNPELYFQIKLYAGTGSAQSVTFDGSEDMQPDWVWGKGRDVANLHALFDSVRGTGKALYTDRTNAEENQAQGVTAFNSDGFSMGTLGDLNASSKNFVAWNWKASGSTSSNSDGSATSTVSANTTAGFSIVSYTGNETAKTIGHGLGAIPQIVITKNRSTTGQWAMYNRNLGANKNLHLETTDAAASSSAVFNDTESTSSVFSVGNAVMTNDNGSNFIAYCFAEKKGYSKFGKYTGNGNADGTFVYTGFRPAMVICKASSDSGDWKIFDNKRIGYNAANYRLYPNATTVETSDSLIDILSNGFKLRTSSDSINGSGNTVIYMAFAENPFVSSGGIPTTAR